MIDVDSYLKRIKCERDLTPTPSLRFLRNLHRAHLLAVPFENLDIHLGNQIYLDISKLFTKIVENGRGGFCYELNSLFNQLLIQLGFKTYIIAAQVYKSDGELSAPFDHMAIVVQIEEKEYLVDVGFGDSFLSPKLIQSDLVQMDYNRYFKLEHTIDEEFILHLSDDSFTYKPQYLFTLKPHQMIEFLGMCTFHQEDPTSHFKKKIVITQAKRDGRVTLTNSKIVFQKSGREQEDKVYNQTDFKSKLHQHFGIQY